MPKPYLPHFNITNKGFPKCKLPTAKITVEKNISSSAFQEMINFKTQVSAQKTQNVHPQEEEMTSPHYHKHPHVIICVQKKSLLPLRNT